MTDPAFRVLEPADSRQVAQLELRCFEHPWSLPMVASELEQEGSIACGFSRTKTPSGPRRTGDCDVELVAYALFKVSLGSADMSRLAVEPSRQHQGIGSNLLGRSLEHLASSGIAEVFLEVRSNNQPAIALYVSHGFERVGCRSAYYPDGTDALVFRRIAPEQSAVNQSST